MGYGDSIAFWLDRVASEHLTNIEKLAKRANILMYQVGSYKNMDKRFKKDVVETLVKDIETFGWADSERITKTIIKILEKDMGDNQ